MQSTIRDILVVGGGTAGWLSAAIIAAHHQSAEGDGPTVTLVESSDVPTVGVGEGTWPTMRQTLRRIGLKEHDVFRQCGAAFKQGGKFVGWQHGKDDFYYHPFTVPLGYGKIDLAPYVDDVAHFATDSNWQQHVCEAGLAPRSLGDNEYEAQCNYAYHVDAGALADLLKNHCRDNLGVTHVVDTVRGVEQHGDGSIRAVQLEQRGELAADLFIDCTGFASLLLGKTLEVPFLSADEYLFNDSALAMHVPYESDDAPLACHTVAAAQNAGWIWDIGLTHRRGVGHVYSSEFLSDDEAEANLRNYLGAQTADIDVRKIRFQSGHRQRYWKHNCVAVGMSGGFVEPLEATAIMLIEIAARYVAEQLPPTPEIMSITARRFNEQMDYRWRRIVDFLKLHYALTDRPEPYWRAHAREDGLPESLAEDLALWSYRGPIKSDFDNAAELFPAASYQYVAYGMGFRPKFEKQSHLLREHEQATRIIERNKLLTQQMLRQLPNHRDYINRWLAAA